MRFVSLLKLATDALSIPEEITPWQYAKEQIPSRLAATFVGGLPSAIGAATGSRRLSNLGVILGLPAGIATDWKVQQMISGHPTIESQAREGLETVPITAAGAAGGGILGMLLGGALGAYSGGKQDDNLIRRVGIVRASPGIPVRPLLTLGGGLAGGILGASVLGSVAHYFAKKRARKEVRRRLMEQAVNK
jgi:hypothetical protein